MEGTEPFLGFDGTYGVTFINKRNVNEDTLREEFETCGEVKILSIVNNRVFVKYIDFDSAKSALSKFKEKYDVTVPRQKERTDRRSTNTSGVNSNGSVSNYGSRLPNNRTGSNNREEFHSKSIPTSRKESPLNSPPVSICEENQSQRNYQSKKESPQKNYRASISEEQRQSTEGSQNRELVPVLSVSSLHNTSSKSEIKMSQSLVPMDDGQVPPPLLDTARQAGYYILVIANLPPRMRPEEVHMMVEEVDPIDITDIQETSNLQIRYCQVCVPYLEDVLYLKRRLDNNYICGHRLIVMEISECVKIAREAGD